MIMHQGTTFLYPKDNKRRKEPLFDREVKVMDKVGLSLTYLMQCKIIEL